MDRTTNSPDNDELRVFITSRDSRCDECGEQLGPHAWILLAGERGALCLSCADLDHLVFLPSGDHALTRRSRKASAVSAVVLKWSKSRKRYERQGLLVEEAALEQAEAECLEDADARERQRERAAERRCMIEDEYLEKFAEHVRRMYPNAPKDREHEIARHACRIHSSRVGRTADAKAFVESAIRSAVAAHIRHRETEYDDLMARGWDRQDARAKVRADVERVVARWTGATNDR
jgi:hypothetical protein